jgi:large subunit ribosomal protein L30
MMATTEKYFEVVLRKSSAGCNESVRATLAGLGLRRIGRKIFLKDTAPIRGMLYKIVHMLEITPCEGELPQSNRAKAKLAA